MRVKIFTLRFSPTLGSFDDAALQEFVRDRNIVAFREHFFTEGGVPFMACVVMFQPPGEAVHDPNRLATSRPRDGNAATGPVESLSESERVLYGTIREWRAQRARKEGVPPYVILTNRELADIVRRRPTSPTALGHVPGIGKAKIERYGSELLGFFGPSIAGDERASGAPAPPDTAAAPASRQRAVAAPRAVIPRLPSRAGAAPAEEVANRRGS